MGAMGRMKRIRIERKRRGASNYIIRVSPSFKNLLEEVRKEMANAMKLPPEKIPTPLITEKIAKEMQNKKKDINKKIADMLDEFVGIK